jgi:hypothetical protein
MALFKYKITKAAGHYHEIVGWDSDPLGCFRDVAKMVNQRS